MEAKPRVLRALLARRRPLKAISLRNFKSLGTASGELALSPLTLLVGPNSAGKSSYLQALLMLRQTVDSRDQESPLITNGNYVKLGGFSDLVSRWATGEAVTFGVTWESSRNLGVASMIGQTPVRPVYELTTKIKVRASDQMSIVGLAMKRVPDGRLIYSLTRTPKGAYRYESEVFPRHHGRESARAYSPHKFYGVRPGVLNNVEISSQVLLRRMMEEFERIMSSIYYLGPLREHPSRIYVRTGERPQDVGLRGEQSVTVLIEDSHVSKPSLVRRVNHWLREFGMARSCKLEKLSNNYYALALSDSATGYSVNIASMGFGVSQVLPVIVQCLYAPVGSTLLIEQPEIHLHPKAQAALADLLLAASREKTIIVETHSEHILARLQRRVGEEEAKPSQIAVYYCEPSQEGTRLSTVTMDQYGQLQSWPSGFFEEELEDRFAHMKAIGERRTKERKQ